MKFEKITESEFKLLKAPELFHNTLGNICYGKIAFPNEINYKFSWQSDLIQPEIIEIKPGIFSIGIDLNITLIDTTKNVMILNILLNHFYYETLIFQNNIYIVSQLEIIQMDFNTLKIIKTHDLPDIFETIIFGEDKIEVACMENNRVELRIK